MGHTLEPPFVTVNKFAAQNFVRNRGAVLHLASLGHVPRVANRDDPRKALRASLGKDTVLSRRTAARPRLERFVKHSLASGSCRTARVPWGFAANDSRSFCPLQGAAASGSHFSGSNPGLRLARLSKNSLTPGSPRYRGSVVRLRLARFSKNLQAR